MQALVPMKLKLILVFSLVKIEYITRYTLTTSHFFKDINQKIESIYLLIKRYFILERPNEETVPFYSLSILICGIACVIEFCGEPANCLGQMSFLANQKVITEATSLLFFHITFVYLAIFFPQLGSLSYAIGRLLYSLIYFMFNFYYLVNKHSNEVSEKLKFKVTFTSLLPEKLSSFNHFDKVN